MFENLTDKLERSFKLIKGEGRITEINVAETLKEIRRALIDADVNYKVAKSFTDEVKQKALGQDVLKSVKPGQMITKIVRDELAQLMGGTATDIKLEGTPAVILIAGLQGSGKTTFSGKLAAMLKSKKGEVAYATDEHFRANATLEDMAKLKPVFVKENGTVTAGNASGINDAAAAVVLMDAAAAKARGAKPLARLVAYAHAGVDPKYMGIGPVPATQLALKKAGLTVNDLDVIEANEAFAAQACAVTKDLGLDPAKVNPNGSGISLGHPIGATGALITVKALHELQRVQGRYALVTMCIGGGQGIAAIFERL